MRKNANKPFPVPDVMRSKGNVSNIWIYLSDNLLSNYGKVLVTNDPNLSEGTMERLLESDPPAGDVKFYFGQNDPTDDVGLALLSICINENPKASMAELVTRYAATRNIRFTDAAIALLKLKKEHGLIRYQNGYGSKIRWEPSVVSTVIRF